MRRQAMTTIRLPRTMYDDDQTEEIALLKIQRETARFIWVDSEDPALGELYSYAYHYSDADKLEGWDESCKRFGPASRRLLAILEAAGWTKARAGVVG